MKDAYSNPADYDENLVRAMACEVLARRIVHNLPAGRLESVMSTRFRYRESDGDASAPVSALETAIDQHCTVRPRHSLRRCRSPADTLDVPLIKRGAVRRAGPVERRSGADEQRKRRYRLCPIRNFRVWLLLGPHESSAYLCPEVSGVFQDRRLACLSLWWVDPLPLRCVKGGGLIRKVYSQAVSR